MMGLEIDHAGNLKIRVSWMDVGLGESRMVIQSRLCNVDRACREWSVRHCFHDETEGLRKEARPQAPSKPESISAATR